MKKLALTILYGLLCINILAQNQSNVHTITQFGIEDDFLVYATHAMYFDNDNWLWIAGKTLNSENKQLSNSTLIIQRYNGHQFYTVNLPEKELQSYKRLTLKKLKNGNLLVLFSNDFNHKLYTINTKTLKFNAVKTFNNIKLDKVRAIKIFDWQDDFLLIGNTNTESVFYKLSTNLNVTKLTEHKKTTSDLQDFSAFTPLKNGFLINSDRESIMLFDKNWNFKKWITPKDIGISLQQKIKLRLISPLVYNDTLYTAFSSNTTVFKYLEKQDIWKPTKLTIEHIKNTKQFNNSHFIKYNFKKNNLVFSKAKNNLDFNDSFTLPIASGNITIASRNFDKELVLSNNGKLYHLVFKANLVSNFLKGYSLRGIQPLTKTKFLVGTVNKGWFVIDTALKTTTPYILKQNNKPYHPTVNRGFQIDGNTIWSNNNNGIIEVDTLSKTFKSYVFYPITCTFFDKQNIYYGTGRYKLMRFDKQLKKNIELAKTDSLLIIDIHKEKNTIYAPTDKGLLVYNENKTQVLKLPDSVSNHLISIDKSQHFGLLIGTVDGSLYSFNKEQNRFKLLYKDSYKSTIVSATDLDKNTLWINTFLGCVKYNTKTKTIKRYGENIGFTNDEANRYSFHVTKDNTFLLGTINGLNIFNPSNFETQTQSLKAELKSVEYYNKATNTWQIITAPKTLNNFKTQIKLPAENRQLKLSVATIGAKPLEKITYEYKLDKSNWIKMQTNQIDFANLSPGKHSITLRAVGKPLNHISNTIALSVYANSFIYQKWWFYPLIILLLCAIAFVYFKELIQRKNAQQQLSQGLIKAQENERARIAMELHDDIGQHLSLLTRKSKTTKNPELQKLANDSLQKLRLVSQGLFPSEIKNQGFTKAVVTMIDKIDANTNINFMREIDFMDKKLSDNESLHLYRILQEILTNCVKHAKATAIEVTGKILDKTINFEVIDNGKGFNFNKEKNQAMGLGMKSIFERAKIINAKINVTSETNNGSTFTIRLPITI